MKKIQNKTKLLYSIISYNLTCYQVNIRNSTVSHKVILTIFQLDFDGFKSKLGLLSYYNLKGVHSSHKSVTIILPNNPLMLPPFSVFTNFHTKLSDSCSGLIIRLERSQCCNQTPYYMASTLRSKDVAAVFQRCGSCVPKM